MPNTAENAQYPVHLLPPRVSLEDILANHIDRYIVLPVPPYSKPRDFETIGRTTFKRYVIRLYTENFSLEKDLWSIPFLLLPEAQNPYIINRPNKQIVAEPAMNIKTEPKHDSMAPSHCKLLL